MNWIERHPRTMLYLMVVTTLNFLLSIIEATHAV